MLFQETDRVQRLRTPMSLLLLDVDRFSALNQRYGCVLGDKVLPLLVSRVRNQLRSYDSLGRVDEDAFLLALPGCVLQHAEQQANRLRQSIARRPFVMEGVEVQVTASFGAAESLGRSPLVVLREAERALAMAKQKGRNCVVAYSQAAATQVLHPESRRKIAAGTSA
jgi:two-component system cell cycle response regulator